MFVLTRANILPILLRRAQCIIMRSSPRRQERPGYFEVLRLVLKDHPDWALDPECVLDERLCERYASLWLRLSV